MVCRARHETNAETGLHGSRTSYTEYAFDRNALLLRACACVLRLMRVWRLITDYYNLYTIQLTAWTDASGFDPRVSAKSYVRPGHNVTVALRTAHPRWRFESSCPISDVAAEDVVARLTVCLKRRIAHEINTSFCFWPYGLLIKSPAVGITGPLLNLHEEGGFKRRRKPHEQFFLFDAKVK